MAKWLKRQALAGVSSRQRVDGGLLKVPRDNLSSFSGRRSCSAASWLHDPLKGMTMIRMSEDMSEQALMELLRQPTRPSPAGLAPSSATAVGGGTVADEIATCLSAENEEASRGCDDLHAPHNLAALREGHLSPDGIQRLAQHVVRCTTCKLLVATIVAETRRAESTGTHAAAPERDDQTQEAARLR